MNNSQQLTIPDCIPVADSPVLKAACEAALAGGQVVLDYYQRGTEMRGKPVGDGVESFNLVSDADLESEQAIAAVLKHAFPEHSLVGEEELKGSLQATDVWIVDPLDGTNNFAHRIPHFAVSIAYYRHGVAACGVVLNPVRGDWYWAEAGRGAYHNGCRLHVSAAQQLAETLVGVGFYYDRGAMMQATLTAIQDFFACNIHGIRRFGTAALDLCQVAEGMFGCFFEYQLAPWDFAAGRLIVEEAGGQITDGHGHPLPLTKTSILASNHQLHEAALQIVQIHHP